MALTADVSIGGVSMSSVGVFEDFGGVFDSAPRRGSGYVLPGVDNEIAVTLPRESYDVSFGVTLLSQESDPSTAFAEITGSYSQLKTVCETGSTVSVNRAMGSINETSYWQNVRCTISLLSPYHARVTVTGRVVTGWASA